MVLQWFRDRDTEHNNNGKFERSTTSIKHSNFFRVSRDISTLTKGSCLPRISRKRLLDSTKREHRG